MQTIRCHIMLVGKCAALLLEAYFNLRQPTQRNRNENIVVVSFFVLPGIKTKPCVRAN